ncbi:MAG TPA: hypothetical protein VFA45_04710, partial [Actinomycetes bacterium]|nr:hypothetical protein [Actinomycetes bacterium]
MPQAWQVAGQRLKLGWLWERRELGLGDLRGLFGLGQRGQLGLPAGLQAACHQAVFGLAGVEGALG